MGAECTKLSQSNTHFDVTWSLDLCLLTIKLFKHLQSKFTFWYTDPRTLKKRNLTFQKIFFSSWTQTEKYRTKEMFKNLQFCSIEPVPSQSAIKIWLLFGIFFLFFPLRKLLFLIFLPTTYNLTEKGKNEIR